VHAAFGLFGQPKSTPPKTTTSSTTASTKLPAGIITACKPGSKNCIVTTWTAPKGGTNNVKATLVKILNAYPQAGQANVDKGGYKIVSSSSNNSPIIKVEYTSGIGTFAKLFNGGQPFVDDLIAVVDNKNGVVTIKSSSRIGQSDLGVNQKRLKFLGAQAKAMGWTVPEPKY
jgi:uncharacterized protein (DUF1499 family)